MRRLRIALLGLIAIGSLLSLAGQAGANEDSSVVVIEVDGTIVPVVAQYIERGATMAQESGATALVIALNTPGGLLTSTEDIVGTILNAEIPVVTYVSPQGAWAASAGTFITLASHVAAMAPGTTIGAATPVASGGEEIPEDQRKKLTEFSAKWMRTIAEERGRNVDEAELAVTESKSFTDGDALKADIIDLRAESLSDLLEAIDGREIELASGRTVTLETAAAAVQVEDMTPFERLLHTITDPNVAYILFTLATIGLITEISSPGLIIPGIVGGVCLILAFYSLGVLDANIGGIALMLMAIGLFVAEYFTTSFGVLTAGGITALVVGSLILFSGTPGVQVDRGLIVAVAISAAAFSFFVVGAIIRGQRRQKATGIEGMAGKPAIARTPLTPRGTVLAEGELWKAEIEEGEAAPGDELAIVNVDRMLLHVRRRPQS